MPPRRSSTTDLFDQKLTVDIGKHAPLADRMRPQNFTEFVGQQKVIGKNTPLRRQIESDALTSVVFWGPPGSGKTTLARIISNVTNTYFQPLSAIGFTTVEFRKIAAEILERRKIRDTRTILFIDEIHRLNKLQQDQLLPFLEKGIITLIGATTENPGFELNSALISRLQVYILGSLEKVDLEELVYRVLEDTERGLGSLQLTVSKKAIDRICELANGDARILFNILERAALTVNSLKEIDEKLITTLIQNVALVYDKQGEEHYNLTSALHKSMRDGDADASIYWLGRMLAGGEDPLYIARRVVRFASEDIGLADPDALSLTVAAKQAVEFIGLPEAETALGEAVVYCARAPKSNEIYMGMKEVKMDIEKFGNLPVPLYLRNASTKLAKKLRYGQGYKYFHEDASAAQQVHLPIELQNRKYLKKS